MRTVSNIFAVLKRLAHDRCIGDADAVIAERDRAAAMHRADLGQFLAGASLGDCADGEDIRQADTARLLRDEIDRAFVIERRLGVGHAADGGESPRHRRRRAGGDGFFFLITRLAEMDMDVDQPRRDKATGRIDDLIGFAKIIADGCDAPVAQKKIGLALELLRGSRIVPCWMRSEDMTQRSRRSQRAQRTQGMGSERITRLIPSFKTMTLKLTNRPSGSLVTCR